MEMLPVMPGRRVRLRDAQRRDQLPKHTLRPPKRRSTIFSRAIHIHVDIGREEFGRGMTTFWWRIVDERDALPPKFLQLCLQLSLNALGRKCWPVYVGMTWRRLITAGAMRQWRPQLEQVNRDVR